MSDGGLRSGGYLRQGDHDLWPAGRGRRGQQYRRPPDTQRRLVPERDPAGVLPSRPAVRDRPPPQRARAGGRGVVPERPLPEGSDRRGPRGRDAVSSDRLRAAGPVLRGHRGSGGTSVRVKEIDSAFTFVPEAGGGLSPRTRTRASTPTQG